MKSFISKYRLSLLSLFSGLLLSCSWPPSPFAFCIFFSWVPLLYVADHTPRRNHFFLFSFIALLTWNAVTTWWIWNSTDVGSVVAIIVNSLFMCLPWWGYHIFKSRLGRMAGYIGIISCWMLFEYIHLSWELSWPWLTLGNVFASHPDWVQWYSYTGAGGGTLWVLVLNVLLYHLIHQQLSGRNLTGRHPKIFSGWVLLLICPIAISETGMSTAGSPPVTDNIVIVQPDIDPYQKFGAVSPAQQVQKLLALSEPAVNERTRLLVWPETALDAGVAETDVATAFVYQPVFEFLKRHPDITLLTGIETARIYGAQKSTSTAHKSSAGSYYDVFNAALVIKNGQPLQFYHKSKLVPGVETLPTFLNFLAPLLEQFGGTTGGYGRDTAAAAFHVSGSVYVPAPIICYESIYGGYITGAVRKGANILAIITNDGWWGNTPGHVQHLAYACLRAVETGRWVVRSANTGISAVINDKGHILETRPWDTTGAIRYNIPVYTRITFYVRMGDYIYRGMSILAMSLILWNIMSWVRWRRRKRTL